MSYAGFLKVGIVPEHLNLSMINMWTHAAIQPEQFYRTGFETIFFNHNRNFALSCVLSSAIPVDKEIVVAGQKHLEEVAGIAGQLDIPFIEFDTPVNELPLIETFLSSQNNVSHLVLVVDNKDSEIEKYINHLRPVLDIKGIDLILYCTAMVESINDRTNGAVDYLVGGWEEAPENAFVVARRSRLVQTEGNSRSLDLDLYSSWQWGLKTRGANILPMEM